LRFASTERSSLYFLVRKETIEETYRLLRHFVHTTSSILHHTSTFVFNALPVL
jgi:hypothetical protein